MRRARPPPRHCRESAAPARCAAAAAAAPRGAGNPCAPSTGRRLARRRRGLGAIVRRAGDREGSCPEAAGGIAGLGSPLALGPAWRAGPAITHNVFRGFRGPLLRIGGVDDVTRAKSGAKPGLLGCRERPRPAQPAKAQWPNSTGLHNR